MVCDCCGRRKKFFESFAPVKNGEDQMSFCVNCNDIAYKVRDAANENDENQYKELKEEWDKRAKKPSARFVKWQTEFIKPLDEKFQKSSEEVAKEEPHK